MKKYYASQDELGIIKGQRVYPREEAMKMANEDDRDTISRHLGVKFWGYRDDLKENGFISVFSNHVPTCVETDAFREWLESEVQRTGNETSTVRYQAYSHILAKYDELNGTTATVEETLKPTPKFKVGDDVIATGCGGGKTRGKVLSVYDTICGIRYDLKMERPGVIGISWQEKELSLCPKTKLVFSLEKAFDKTRKEQGLEMAIRCSNAFVKWNGKQANEMGAITNGDTTWFPNVFAKDSDLFIEVEVK